MQKCGGGRGELEIIGVARVCVCVLRHDRQLEYYSMPHVSCLMSLEATYGNPLSRPYLRRAVDRKKHKEGTRLPASESQKWLDSRESLEKRPHERLGLRKKTHEFMYIYTGQRYIRAVKALFFFLEAGMCRRTVCQGPWEARYRSVRVTFRTCHHMRHDHAFISVSLSIPLPTCMCESVYIDIHRRTCPSVTPSFRATCGIPMPVKISTTAGDACRRVRPDGTG